nr:YigZ family protein [Pseudooceanicola aestuarii]
MIILENVLSDRGSRYAVAGGPASSRAEADALIKSLKRKKKFARATHNSWALLLPDTPVKSDDGEAGAGMVILRMLERAELENHLIVVTRWFGGTHLGGDRFRHIQTATRAYFNHLEIDPGHG